MPAPPLILQTTYAELLERCATDAFAEAFPENGTFVAKTIKGRRYWYFQQSVELGRGQRYVGPETPSLIEWISRHRQARSDQRERSTAVSTLVRLGMPRPTPEMGRIVEALAKAGVFRLRSVLVGTIAYQTYSAMLGERIPHSLLSTDDVDIAQFASTSAAIGDKAPPMLEILKSVDGNFAEVPNIHRKPTSYSANSGRLRVDILTPNEGADTDEPQLLPALQTFAQPLRFLDFLIHEPEPAVLLHGTGVYVLVPAPARYAVHKLIVAQRRSAGSPKPDKDIRQAEALSLILSAKRPHEFKAAWDEAYARWPKLLSSGLALMSSHGSDILLKTVGRPRGDIPGLDLTFQNPPVRYVADRDIVAFDGDADGERVQCAISREALDDHYGADGFSREARVEVVLKNRSEIEQLARTKYLRWPVEDPAAVLVKTHDVPELREQIRTGSIRPAKKQRARRST